MKKLNRKILVTRSSGMKLFYLANFSRIISFSGILEMHGEKLNEYFREMETPAHDKWLPSRYQNDPDQAKAYYDELKQWIRDIVLSLGENQAEDEVEVEGLNGVLQQDSSVATSKGDESKESLNDSIDKIIIQPRITSQQKPKGFFHGKEGDGKSNSRDREGTISKAGSLPTTRSLGGNRHRTKREKHKGLPDGIGNDIVHEMQGGNIHHNLSNVRIIKVGTNNYRVSFMIPRDVRKGHVEIVAIGENGRTNKLFVKAATSISSCKIEQSNALGISFVDMKCEDKVIIEFSLVDSRDYAMEVNVYEHN